MNSKLLMLRKRNGSLGTYGHIRYLEMEKSEKKKWQLAFKNHGRMYYWLALDLSFEQTISFETVLVDNVYYFSSSTFWKDNLSFLSVFLEAGGTPEEFIKWYSTVGDTVWYEYENILAFMKIGLGPNEYAKYKHKASWHILKDFIDKGFNLTDYLFITKMLEKPQIALKVIKRLIEKGYVPTLKEPSPSYRIYSTL